MLEQFLITMFGRVVQFHPVLRLFHVGYKSDLNIEDYIAKHKEFPMLIMHLNGLTSRIPDIHDAKGKKEVMNVTLEFITTQFNKDDNSYFDHSIPDYFAELNFIAYDFLDALMKLEKKAVGLGINNFKFNSPGKEIEIRRGAFQHNNRLISVQMDLQCEADLPTCNDNSAWLGYVDIAPFTIPDPSVLLTDEQKETAKQVG